MRQMSHVKCHGHVLSVICHVLRVKCHIFFSPFFDKVVEPVGEGLLSIGPTPSILIGLIDMTIVSLTVYYLISSIIHETVPRQDMRNLKVTNQQKYKLVYCFY